MTVDERAAVVPRFKPELASCNLGSINWGVFSLADKFEEFKTTWEKSWFASFKGYIFPNTFADLENITSIMNEAGTKPEFECYDIGHLNNLAYLMQAGFVKPPVYIQFITGILGGIPATPYDLMNLHNSADRILGRGSYQWSAVGAGRQEFPICTMSLLLGGHARIGMEDNLFLAKGVKAKSNAELVGKMIRIMREFDLEPATPQEAREILNLAKYPNY